MKTSKIAWKASSPVFWKISNFVVFSDSLHIRDHDMMLHIYKIFVWWSVVLLTNFSIKQIFVLFYTFSSTPPDCELMLLEMPKWAGRKFAKNFRRFTPHGFSFKWKKLLKKIPNSLWNSIKFSISIPHSNQHPQMKCEEFTRLQDQNFNHE